MSLPMFTTPKHRIELPSTGEKIEFRPFLVKEQKLLLMAINGDAEQQISAMGLPSLSGYSISGSIAGVKVIISDLRLFV